MLPQREGKKTRTMKQVNLLIAMMSETFSAVKEDADRLWRFQYAAHYICRERESSEGGCRPSMAQYGRAYEQEEGAGGRGGGIYQLLLQVF